VYAQVNGTAELVIGGITVPQPSLNTLLPLTVLWAPRAATISLTPTLKLLGRVLVNPPPNATLNIRLATETATASAVLTVGLPQPSLLSPRRAMCYYNRPPCQLEWVQQSSGNWTSAIVLGVSDATVPLLYSSAKGYLAEGAQVATLNPQASGPFQGTYPLTPDVRTNGAAAGFSWTVRVGACL
jgi:hypothetical protein